MTSRFVRFNGVGLLGFVLQIAVLALLLKAHVQYLAATALAVEAALLHNFLWHERWTWIDRPAAGRARLERLWRFHVLNGVVSLVGNLLLMRLLVGVLGFPLLPSNAVAVLVCAAINFTASDRVVFEVRRPTSEVRRPRCEVATRSLFWWRSAAPAPRK
ncbi:MAG TPA: GtrA family protein [Vicinamibacterales bacterium]|jgi:putative flippase GtrA|nr:GtrA family protein [Vicinamibacterales bacterium]